MPLNAPPDFTLAGGIDVVLAGPVTSEQVDTYGRLREIEDRSNKARVLLEAWERQHNEEREMRRVYGRVLLIALLMQAALVNTAFFLIGTGVLKVDQWVAQTFILAVFAEISAMTFWIVKYLFPKISSDVLSVVEKL